MNQLTCHDCIHYDVCDYHITEMTTMTIAECSHEFKNKADFVEVVRCKDCIHSKEYPMRIICHRFGRDTTENDFCSYGERAQDIGLDKENDDDSEGIEGIEDKTPGNDSDGTDGSSCC